MTAIILCAGSARRFFPEGTQSPKCLLPLTENETILDRQLRQVCGRGYRVVLGTGCGRAQVAERAARYPDVRCVYNPDYETTNSIVTLFQMREFVGDATLIINGDLVVDDNVFDLFDDAPSPQLLVKRLPAFDDDTYRVVFNGSGLVVEMGKEIRAAPSPTCAAFLGISRVGCAALFLKEIRALLEGGNDQTWPTTAYRRMMSALPVRVVDVGSAMFFDVDTPAEHEAAKRELMSRAR
jgi:2-aminoethylphosphonate-pyruvate transaminase